MAYAEQHLLALSAILCCLTLGVVHARLTLGLGLSAVRLSWAFVNTSFYRAGNCCTTVTSQHLRPPMSHCRPPLRTRFSRRQWPRGIAPPARPWRPVFRRAHSARCSRILASATQRSRWWTRISRYRCGAHVGGRVRIAKFCLVAGLWKMGEQDAVRLLVLSHYA